MGINSNNLQASCKAEYTRTVDVIALGLLLQAALAHLSPAFLSVLMNIHIGFGITKNSTAYMNLSEIINILLYAVIFLVPAFFISKYLPKKQLSIYCKPKLPKLFLPTAVMTLGTVAVAGHITTCIQDVLYNFGISFKTFSYTVPDDIFGIILLFISSAVVPAIVEEILFRKVILDSLLPYGNLFAVIVSAACFALMHANPTQTLYTFVAGIFLAVITVKEKNIFPAIIIHSANNTLSIIYLMIQKNASSEVYTATVSAVELILKISGLVVLGIMLRRGFFKSDKNKALHGFSPAKNLFRIFTAVYIVYVVFLSMQWVNFR